MRETADGEWRDLITRRKQAKRLSYAAPELPDVKLYRELASEGVDTLVQRKYGRLCSGTLWTVLDHWMSTDVAAKWTAELQGLCEVRLSV